jgi:hypothetical protein
MLSVGSKQETELLDITVDTGDFLSGSLDAKRRALCRVELPLSTGEQRAYRQALEASIWATKGK